MAERRTSRLRETPRLDLDTRFASCRSMGHEWHHSGPIGVDDTSDTFRRPFGASTGMVGLPSACEMCGTSRMRWVTRSGEVVTRYEYPEGYSRHGDDRLTVREWRSTYVSTLFDQFEQAVNSAPRRRSRRSS